MPTYNAIQTDRLENFVRRYLAVRNGGILPTVAPELGVEVTLPQLEDAMGLAGYIPWGAGSEIAAVAANFSIVHIANLTAAQLMVVQVTLATTAALTAYWSLGPAPGAALIAAGDAGWRDSRRTQGSFPLNANGIQIQAGVIAAIPPAAHNRIAATRLAANTPATSPWVVLSPGQGFAGYLNTVNLAMTFSVTGYLRDMVPDEDTI